MKSLTGLRPVSLEVKHWLASSKANIHLTSKMCPSAHVHFCQRVYVPGADIPRSGSFQANCQTLQSLCRRLTNLNHCAIRRIDAVVQVHHDEQKYLCRVAGKPPIKSLLGESSKGAFSRLCSGTEPESPPSACEGGRWFLGGLRARLRSNLLQPRETRVSRRRRSW